MPQKKMEVSPFDDPEPLSFHAAKMSCPLFVFG